MSKAYHRVEWRYLKALMSKLRFDEFWKTLIIKCMSSVSYSFKVNDNMAGRVTYSRGLQKRDFLTPPPHLFVCSQGLFFGITSLARDNKIHGVNIARGSPIIIHLFFADDSLIFFKATSEDCESLKNDLKSYEKASGQIKIQ